MAVVYSQTYLDRVAWADQKCAEIETPWFDVSILPVSWDDTKRQNHLLRTIRLYGEDNDNAWDNGADDETNDYFSALGFLIFLCFIMVGVSLICCGTPLWIARCCAHRCCRHSAKPYTLNARRRAVGCCTLMGILTFVFFVIGTLAGAASTPGIQETMCGYDTLLRNSTDFVRNIDTYITSLQDLGLPLGLSTQTRQLLPRRTHFAEPLQLRQSIVLLHAKKRVQRRVRLLLLACVS